MSKSKSFQTKKPVYGNCKVESIDGIHIFNTSQKVRDWYLKKNLAAVIQESPSIIRLNFVSKANGKAADPFYLQTRSNICVVCGADESLNRHHVVPIMYRKHFPIHIKDHASYDILAVCVDCHLSYEIEADKLKLELLEEFNISRDNQASQIDRDKHRIATTAGVLLNHADKIPEQRREEMWGILKLYFGKNDINTAELETASKLNYHTPRSNWHPEGKLIVDALDDLNSFVRRWRQNFIDNTKPKFLPEYWVVDRPVENT